MSIAHPNDFPGAYIWGAQGQWFCYDTSTGPEIGQGWSLDILTIDTEVQSYSRYWARKSALTDLEHIIAKLQSGDKKDEPIERTPAGYQIKKGFADDTKMAAIKPFIK